MLSKLPRIPTALLVLVPAAVVAALVPGRQGPSEHLVTAVVTVALALILFDGGMHIGVGRFRAAAAPIVVVGLVGTFLTAAGGAVLLHLAFGLDWYLALLVATAVAPTDPAVVFSVLGKREIAGRSGTILEGESGANDPVGIALMASLLAAGGLSGGAFGSVAGQFLLQLVIGGLVGVLGGRVLVWFVHRDLPVRWLYALGTLVATALAFTVAALAHGSGFLAVFLAGIVVGDAQAPFQHVIDRFHSAIGGVAEIVAFCVLGLTIDLSELGHGDVLGPGLVLAIALAVVVRPVAVGLCLWPVRLRRNEKTFVLFAGLKGAVPLLLGYSMIGSDVADAARLYGIVVVVVIFSVLVQGGLTPSAARVLRVPMRTPRPASPS